MHTRTVRDVLGELFTLLFKRSETHANPGEVFDQLTPREREIALLASQGFTNKEIAEQSVIAPDTVKTHMRNILNETRSAQQIRIASLLGKSRLVEIGRMKKSGRPAAFLFALQLLSSD